MLKCGPTRAARPPPSTSDHLLLDSEFQISANPPSTSGSSDKWNAYVNGGAKADDARLLQKRREEDAAYEAARFDSANRYSTQANAGESMCASGKLIETSPQKPHASISANTSLLVDLDINRDYETHLQQPKLSYASTAGPGNTKGGQFKINLLD